MWFLAAICTFGIAAVYGQCDDGTRPLPINTSPYLLQSPGYDGTTPYADNLLCEWIITSPQDVRFLLTSFGLEDCIDCACDSLQLYNGPDDTAPLIYNLCGGDLDILPAELVSDSQMFVRFQTDTGNTGAVFGFSGSVTFVDAACDTDNGKTLPGPSGFITSPNFPSNYPTSTSCQWNFVANPGELIELDFVSLDVQDGCNEGFGQGVVFDYVQFIDSDLTTSLGRFFGSECVPGFKFKNHQGDRAYLQFWSDSSTVGQGFNVTYRYV